jgi:hypothetical protein
MNKADVISKVSEQTGIAQDCQKVLTALEAVVRDGISDKLSAFTKLFSKS